jgi:hypothetical protein
VVQAAVGWDVGANVGLEVGTETEEVYISPGNCPAMSKLPELLDATHCQFAAGADVVVHVEP